MKSEESYRERECVHRAQGAKGEHYGGSVYVEHLQRLSSAEALRFAGRVTPFFWSDAARVSVWLCEACAAELGLHDYEEVSG
jgi:hypothetical protein